MKNPFEFKARTNEIKFEKKKKKRFIQKYLLTGWLAAGPLSKLF